LRKYPFSFLPMRHRTPQRTYTPHSIEAWFDRVNSDWEKGFNKEELDWGRRFYRRGEVRSLELLDTCAIIHFKQGKEPLYVIVDWEERGLSFRESHPEAAPGKGLVVAGMYELEEFIADELPPVTELRAGETSKRNNGARPAHEKSEVPVEKTPPRGRKLHIRLLGKADGLWMEAGWKAEDRSTDWSNFSLRELTRWEREQLIGFTARAHRNGFRPGDREGTYRLQDPVALHRFFKTEFREWCRRYTLTEGKGLESWREGVKRVTPLLEVTASGLKSRFQFSFESESGPLSAEIGERLFRHPGHVQFVPGQGIYQVEEKALPGVHEWKSLFPSEGEGIMPRYLLFTFTRDPHVRLKLSEEINAWRSQLEETVLVEESNRYTTLRPYQREGLEWLRKLEAAGCHGLLADEMGLGKTLQVLSYLDMREALGKRPVLVVCPASVVPVWQAEVRRFFPETPVEVLSSGNPFDEKRPALWLSSYTQLRRNKPLLDTVEFAYAILDEAQSIKNPDAKATHACFSIRADQRIALTGTPLENRPLDLWTLFRFLMPGFLGTRRSFERQVRDRDSFLPLLRQQVAPFILRRTKLTAAADLPPKVEIDWVCPLTAQQRHVYDTLTAEAKTQFKGGLSRHLKQDRMHLFSLLTRLRQASCDPALLPGRTDHWNQSGKLASLRGRLEEALQAGSKIVIFSQFVKFLRRSREVAREAFPDIPQFELTGSTLDREAPVERFRSAEGAALFFISLRAGGTGLNLQEADYVFLLDPWWNPAVEAQAIDRVHRIGQEKRVMVYRLITRGTIEERIERLKKSKSRLFDDLLSDLDAPADLLKQFDSIEDLIQLEE